MNKRTVLQIEKLSEKKEVIMNQIKNKIPKFKSEDEE